MNLVTWAEKEVELACKKERVVSETLEGELDYGCACYESALNAYKEMLKGEHSGFSWQLTTDIFNRLAKGLPLTPITDKDFEKPLSYAPDDFLKEACLKSETHCARMSSLFRSEHMDGTITYSDVNRYFCFEEENRNDTYCGGGAASILDNLFPITMPYYPSINKYKICCSTFLVDMARGDFDTKGYLYVITPDGTIVWLNKFFKEIPYGDTVTTEREVTCTDKDGDNKVEVQKITYQPTKWVEICKEEFEERKKNRIDVTK